MTDIPGFMSVRTERLFPSRTLIFLQICRYGLIEGQGTMIIDNAFVGALLISLLANYRDGNKIH